MSDSSPTIADVYAVEDQRFAAMSANDVDALDLLLADDMRYVHSNGLAEDKTQYLASLRSGTVRYLGFKGVERTARQEGGFTFVFGEADLAVDKPGGVVRKRLTYTAVYRHQPRPMLMACHCGPSLNG